MLIESLNPSPSLQMRSVGCGDRSSGPPLAPTVAMGAGGGWSYAGGGPSGAPGKPWFR